ncbi:hypothetical protein TREMEDRAFT_69428 [Tremella mesenterica DSM 1558]|uniref:uncharacterized protein n=1 Tax=Tremella mesenterica (strain ATCC 24925 / CBS 8224 / DSM 1558 / NBRC 9311 / NRRL Y-6157 / RJB 2259-6 / UBC 559-6) TaxID=578456 RepID=UPI0003F4A227|nr:uncharacterized protein TREMEDRAFT_69428 [Tremella mesenterica DSM 1558]EIW67834.1 hypothetical protein TREMEDRAFT_69428 [Tremella mesenterica DSM 1558]
MCCILATASSGDSSESTGSDHPTEDKPRSPTEGKAVAEHAKLDEGAKSGVSEEVLAPLQNIPTPELFSLKNRTIIVTGAGRGLGLTLAHGFIESGAHVRAIDILSKPTEPYWSTASSLASSKGLTLEYHNLDITSESSTSKTFSKLFSSAPSNAPIRGLYISAGINHFLPAEEFSAEQFRRVIDINLTGTFISAQAFAKEWFKKYGDKGEILKAGEGASIVFTGSMSGHIANAGLMCAPYGASKAGVNQLVRNLAMEWSKKGIRVNIQTTLNNAVLAEHPEYTDLWVSQSLLGRLSTADEFRGPATFLLSDASSFMTGADIISDGGHTAT